MNGGKTKAYFFLFFFADLDFVDVVDGVVEFHGRSSGACGSIHVGVVGLFVGAERRRSSRGAGRRDV